MINSIEAVFIYKNFKKIKCLNYKDALENHDNLVKNCWEHTATLNLCSFLEYLYNEKSDEEIIYEIKNYSRSCEFVILHLTFWCLTKRLTGAYLSSRFAKHLLPDVYFFSSNKL